MWALSRLFRQRSFGRAGVGKIVCSIMHRSDCVSPRAPRVFGEFAVPRLSREDYGSDGHCGYRFVLVLNSVF